MIKPDDLSSAYDNFNDRNAVKLGWGSSYLDQVWSILPAIELFPLKLSRWPDKSRGNNSNAGKMYQTWSSSY